MKLPKPNSRVYVLAPKYSMSGTTGYHDASNRDGAPYPEPQETIFEVKEAVFLGAAGVETLACHVLIDKHSCQVPQEWIAKKKKNADIMCERYNQKTMSYLAVRVKKLENFVTAFQEKNEKTCMNPKNKTLTIVLAIFLGGVGAHHFYLERPGKAILYLLFCWTFVPAILAFIEALIYLRMNPREWEVWSQKRV